MMRRRHNSGSYPPQIDQTAGPAANPELKTDAARHDENQVTSLLQKSFFHSVFGDDLTSAAFFPISLKSLTVNFFSTNKPVRTSLTSRRRRPSGGTCRCAPFRCPGSRVTSRSSEFLSSGRCRSGSGRPRSRSSSCRQT